MPDTDVPALCPKGHPMERREGMFYWRGDSRPGHVCPICKSLWAIEGEEIEPLANERARSESRHNFAMAAARNPDAMLAERAK